MSAKVELRALRGEDGWPIFTFGPWLLRPSTVLRRRKKERWRVFFLLPPPGFTGGARLGVITPRGREEFFAAWRDGRIPEPDAGPTARLDACFEGLLAPDPAQRPSSAARWPLIVHARTSGPRGAAEVDLLLEAPPSSLGASEAVSGEDGDPPLARLSGSLRLPGLRLDATRVYLLAMLPSLKLRPPSETQERRRELIAAALHQAERHKAIRLGLPDDWAPLVTGSSLENLVQRLGREGRLEVLHTGSADEDALAGLRLPYAGRVGLTHGPGEPPATPDRGLRAVLQLPEETSAECAPAAPVAFAAHRWRKDVAGRRLEVAVRQTADGDLFDAHRQAYAYAFIDQVVRSALLIHAPPMADPVPEMGAAPPSQRPTLLKGLHALGCLPLRIDRPEGWREMAGALRRWEKVHASPQIVSATPSDYVTLVEQLQELDAVRVATG